ncbi:hypothetical protein ABBQ38_001634 [Trebouxia sp. C0009 RCD-2024]
MPVFSKGSRFHDVSVSSHRAWTVQRRVGEGQSAEVYSVRCDEEPSSQYAVKIEREPGIRTLKAELKILKQLQNSPHACQLIEHGTYQGHDYIVMELLGCNAVELRKAQAPRGRWGTDTVKQLGLPMLAALEEMHRNGLLHRDVKPANFGVSPAGYMMSSDENFEGTLKVIDFGLSKRYLDEQGSVIPRRDGRTGFRGSTAYASVYAHEELEQGRRDDLWSWLYVLTEMLDGGLCWRMAKDKADRQAEDATRRANPKHVAPEKQRKKDVALKMKRAALADPDLLTANVVLPDGLKAISNHLKTLDFADAPDYSLLRAHLTSMPDGFPPRKLQPHPSNHPLHTTPSLVAVPQPEAAPILGMQYPPAHPSSDAIPPMQYPDAAWAPLEQQYGYGYGGQGMQTGAWQGYEQNGYGGSAAHAWDPAAAIHHQHSWYPPDHAQYNGYSSAAGIPETPMSPLEEQQGYSPKPHPVAPSPNPSHGGLSSGRAAELEELKRDAQRHMQRSLVNGQQHDTGQDPMRHQHPSATDPPHPSGQAADLSRANGHSNSMKRGRSSDSVVEHACSKRSRLGMPAVPHVNDLLHKPAVLGPKDPQEIPLPSDTEADARYQGVQEMVHQVQNDQVSQHACQLKGQLRNLDAAEGIGVMAWLIDGMLSQRADPSARELITDWVMDLAEFAKHRAQMCRT